MVTTLLYFQSPFHRVKGCNLPGLGWVADGGWGELSIPFSSGQRMQHTAIPLYHHPRRSFNPLFIGSKDATGAGISWQGAGMGFQSPFHRVKGCNETCVVGDECYCVCSFNPLFIGSKDATILLPTLGHYLLLLSIPFSSGQRMQLTENLYLPFVQGETFNPLFIGSKDATGGGQEEPTCRLQLSIPFSSGQRMQPYHPLSYVSREDTPLSIPFSSGQRMQPGNPPA